MKDFDCDCFHAGIAILHCTAADLEECADHTLVAEEKAAFGGTATTVAKGVKTLESTVTTLGLDDYNDEAALGTDTESGEAYAAKHSVHRVHEVYRLNSSSLLLAADHYRLSKPRFARHGNSYKETDEKGIAVNHL